MKKFKIISIITLLVMIFCTCSCSLIKENLENATIYTTAYPINYLTKYLYEDYGKISSIYPLDSKISDYKPTDKQISTYAKGDVFIYNGLTNEKDLAKKFVNKNGNLLIIDVSYGLTYENGIEEFWLSPNNYLMLAKNIKDSLIDSISSKIITEYIDKKYDEFEEKISIMDASLHTIGKNAKDNDKNIIIASSSVFKYLENYGFKVIALDDKANLKENKLNQIKTNFKEEKYKYILTANGDESSDVIKDLVDHYSAKLIQVDMLTSTLTDDYFSIMTEYIDNIKTITE